MTERLLTAAALFAAFFLMAGTPGGGAWAASAGSAWGADYFPNVPVVTQDGKTLRFYDDLLKDKQVLVNFIYTRCERACPLDTANMARVQKLLGDKVGRQIFMYSITLDPEHDTPEALKAYAEKFGAGPGWLFLTGKREDIDKIRFKLGDRGKMEEHANTVRVGDVARGRWIRIPLNGDPNYVAMEITNTLDPDWSVGKNLTSIAGAEQLPVFGPGQVLFYNRCGACHTIGKGDHLGPDLKGVTSRREQDWLMRFIYAPDRMRAKNDPIAVELAKNYKVLMPNLGLTNKELDDVVEYLEAMDRPRPAEGPKAASAAAEEAKPVAHDEHEYPHAGTEQ